MGLSLPRVIFIYALAALLLVLGRLAISGFDASYFIVAGTDYVDPHAIPTPLVLQPGQGYDGQFFYRYSLHPLDFSKQAHGITVDHPAYRMQRIGYPLLVWLLSLGGMPPLVPYSMVLVNLLAFLGIGYFTIKLTQLLGALTWQALYPLLLCGLYMSIARDLSEILELCCFSGMVYYLFARRYALLALFATLTILTRETAAIALLPVFVWLLLYWRHKGVAAKNVLFLAPPFLALLLWKGVIYLNIPSLTEASAGHTSIGMPLKGIVDGLRQNLDFTDNKHILQFIFWCLYMAWQILFAMQLFSKVSFRNLLANESGALKLTYLVWLLFALCFSDNIYGDDWGFVRIFSLWNMVGILLIITTGKKTGKLFNAFSIAIVMFTIARLAVRV
jgi:hypothetical protein